MTLIEPLCTVAVGLGGLSLALSLASLLGRHTDEPEAPAVVPAPTITEPDKSSERISLKMTGARLKKLCQQHRIHNAKWRAAARKTCMVRALHAAGVTHG